MGTLSDFTNQLDSTSSKRELTCVRYCCQPRVVGWSSASGQYLLPSSTCLLLWVSSQRDVLESVPPLCCSCPASWLLLLILFYPPFTGCLGLTLLPKGLNALAFLPFVFSLLDFLFPWMLKTLLLFFHPSEILVTAPKRQVLHYHTSDISPRQNKDKHNYLAFHPHEVSNTVIPCIV